MTQVWKNLEAPVGLVVLNDEAVFGSSCKGCIFATWNPEPEVSQQVVAYNPTNSEYANYDTCQKTKYDLNQAAPNRMQCHRIKKYYQSCGLELTPQARGNCGLDLQQLRTFKRIPEGPAARHTKTPERGWRYILL